MNRKSAYDNSEDSESDWDSTVNESPTHAAPPQISMPTKEDESDYATVLPKSQKNLKAEEVIDNKERNITKVKNGKTSKSQSRGLKLEQNQSQIDNMKELNASANSPPPHLSSFRNALSDYSTVYEVVPDIPSRGYEGKGKLYTVPESDMFISPQSRDAVNWNDSDAEERVLKELQQEREKQKKLIATSKDRKQIMPSVDKSSIAAENLGYLTSPQTSRFKESEMDKKNQTNESHSLKSPPVATSPDRNADIVKISGNLKDSVPMPQMFQSKMSAPVIIKDATGKSCIFYFEEGSPHFVEVSDDEIHAFLPEKVDELEKLFRRVWREVFAALRVVTSIIILFFAELILFLVHHIVRPLLLDTIRGLPV
ncbi:hypothetical protein Btru_073002 [Bulinus truncatus]|nr:hypothetical protein Btru_073002 [Bulinus truncatus]